MSYVRQKEAKTWSCTQVCTVGHLFYSLLRTNTAYDCIVFSVVLFRRLFTEKEVKLTVGRSCHCQLYHLN